MKYQINTTNYHTFDVYEVNKKAPRSYFIPYPDKASADAVTPDKKRYSSAKVKCLNGDWDFKFYANPNDMPVELDTSSVTFDKIDVPSCWQFRGYDKPFYLNIRYQFPYDPPVIPKTEPVGKVFSWIGSDTGIGLHWNYKPDNYNFVGLYRTFFTVDDMSKNYVLSFLGVATCLDLYINGSFVGYSEGSHNIAEFDVTSYLTEGENELVAVVHRWCTGTYLEAQDMFRNNGIFRDVLLYVNEPVDFWDIDFKTAKYGVRYQANISAELTGDTDVTVLLEGNGLSVGKTVSSENGRINVTFDELAVEEWNAENPVLYNLYLKVGGSCVKLRVGFKTVKIDERLYYFNDHLIKFKGVNHHDTSAINGYTMSPADIERDIMLCKEHNIDTIRTSHYPPDPYLIELCDEKGIYVCDETDLETHGVFAQALPPSYNRISNDPKWEPRYVDRVSRLYQRDKLHPSIFLWSLGNEAGGICNTDAEYNYLKAHTDIPVHYESVIHTKRTAYDVGSEMYPTIDNVIKVGEGTRKEEKLNDRPYFLCEYEHAMGVGPGAFDEYWQTIFKYDNLMGGCVWEMVDHAVLEEDGSYTYGGDHGEYMHDSNFCVDGLFYPDRKPSTGAKIVKHAYRPLRVSCVAPDTYEIFNTLAFSNGVRYKLEFTWTDGEKSLGIASLVPKVEPLSRVNFTVNPEVCDSAALEAAKSLYVNIRTIDQRNDAVVAEEQITLKQTAKAAPAADGSLPATFSVSNGCFRLSLDQAEMVAADPYTILFRAGTDNDVSITGAKCMAPFYNEAEATPSVTQDGVATVVKTLVTAAKGKYEVTDRYENTPDGILVTSTIHRLSGKGALPRFGKTFRLPESFDTITYTGRLGESYCDMKDQFIIGTETRKVIDMTEPNIRPQESGNRCDCSVASVTDGRSTVTFEAVDGLFELAVKPYSDRELTQMKHRPDEKVTGTYISIQAFQQGIGTGSCGPATLPKFKYDGGRDYTLKFLIRYN